MKKANTDNSIPEIIMQATVNRIANSINEVTLFLTPVHSERSERLLGNICEIRSLTEIFDTQYKSWKEMDRLSEKLSKGFNLIVYQKILSESQLTLVQQKMLVMMYAIFQKAKDLRNRYFVESFSDPECAAAKHSKCCEQTMDYIKTILISMKDEVPGDDVCKLITQKFKMIYSLLPEKI